MKKRAIFLITAVAVLSLAMATYADTGNSQAPVTKGKTTIGSGTTAGVCDGSGAANAGQARGNRQGQKGSGQGDQIRKRDGSSGGNPTQTRQGQRGSRKGRGRG